MRSVTVETAREVAHQAARSWEATLWLQQHGRMGQGMRRGDDCRSGTLQLTQRLRTLVHNRLQSTGAEAGEASDQQHFTFAP